jgi:membrane-associated phospholipid phosphatase
MNGAKLARRLVVYSVTAMLGGAAISGMLAPDGRSTGFTASAAQDVSTVAGAEPTCLGTPPGPSARPARLVAAYAFENVIATSTPDASGNNRPGSLVDATLTSGRFGRGLALNGTSGYMRIDEPQWPTGDYTYAAWVLPRHLSEWRAILEIQTPDGRGLELAIDGSGQVELWSAGARRLRSGVQLTAGRWTHVALTRSAHLLTFHVDGIAGGVARNSTVFNFGSCPALVGVDADLGCTRRLNGFFDGVIDELRVYDCALAEDGVRSIMETAVDPSAKPTVGGPISPASSPRAGLLRNPPGWDVGLVARLAQSLGRRPELDRFIQEAGAHGIFGGIWYAAAVFVLWVRGTRSGHENLRHRTLLLVLGSMTATSLTFLAARMVSWPPPSTHPGLAALYPGDFPANLNPSSFPSQSTALHAAVSAGLYAIVKPLGVLAWIGVGLLVALPRMYLGSHYLTDVVAGLVLGVGGYWIAVRLLQPVARWCAPLFDRPGNDWGRIVAECAVFLWILQLATGFGLARWVLN